MTFAGLDVPATATWHVAFPADRDTPSRDRPCSDLAARAIPHPDGTFRRLSGSNVAANVAVKSSVTMWFCLICTIARPVVPLE